MIGDAKGFGWAILIALLLFLIVAVLARCWQRRGPVRVKVHHEHGPRGHRGHKGHRGATGPTGAPGAPGSSSSVLPFASGAFTFVNPVFLSNLLSDDSIWLIGQTAALSPSDNLQTTLDAARNSFALTAPRSGTLANLELNLMLYFQGDASQPTLTQDLTFDFVVKTAPTTFASNDFTSSTIVASITIPAGTSSLDNEIFLQASDLLHTVPVLQGQRVLLEAAVSPNGGNASDITTFLALSGGLLIS